MSLATGFLVRALTTMCEACRTMVDVEATWNGDAAPRRERSRSQELEDAIRRYPPMLIHLTMRDMDYKYH